MHKRFYNYLTGAGSLLLFTTGSQATTWNMRLPHDVTRHARDQAFERTGSLIRLSMDNISHEQQKPETKQTKQTKAAGARS